jgi:predicted DCC family thiol-disulfide oxidoreductase YuxK
MTGATGSPILLYDGVCGFCNGAVQFILAHDRIGTMLFTPLQSDVGAAVRTRHPILNGVDSVVYLEPSDSPVLEHVFIRSAAALKIAQYLGGPWRLLLAFRLVPTPIRDLLYDLFARYRYHLFGRHDSCLTPSPETRSRFIGEY